MKNNNMHEAIEENNPYRQYQETGGIINKKDYESALTRAQDAATTTEDVLVKQAQNIAEFAGIELHNEKDAPDPRVVLYGVLRTDAKPEDTAHHHSQMSDQRLFAEALRMLGDTASLQKLIAAYPNISFE